MFWPYAVKTFVEQLNEHKVDNDGISLMEKFSVKTTGITIKISTHGAVQFLSWINIARQHSWNKQVVTQIM